MKFNNRWATEYNESCLITEDLETGSPFIGEGTWIGYHTVIDGSGGLKIGKHCSIASGVHIYTHDSVRWATKNLLKDGTHIDRSPTIIGDNCFIGANSVILRGVIIGNRVTIGAGSIVNINIPDDCVAVGNPAKIVKQWGNG